MRPRKQILLFAESVINSSVLAYVLNQQPRFSVTKADDDAEFRQLLPRAWEVVIIPHTNSKAKTLDRVKTARKICGCPILVLAFSKDVPPHTTDAVVLAYGTPNAEVIETLNAVTKKKRGPKPHTLPQPLMLEVA